VGAKPGSKGKLDAIMYNLFYIYFYCLFLGKLLKKSLMIEYSGIKISSDYNRRFHGFASRGLA
jgi:hypothetical protein